MTPYHPQGNGAAERMVRAAKEMLAPMLNGELNRWPILLPEAQFAYNMKVHERHGSTPFSLMFARQANPLLDDRPGSDVVTRRALTESEQKAQLRTMSEIVFPAISERTKTMAQKAHERFCKNHRMVPNDLPPGTMVMALVQDRNQKLDPRYEGPYMVIRKNRRGAYVLRDAMGTILPRRFPVNHLRLISHKGILSEESFVVERVLDHQNMGNQCEYLVKWEGFPDSENTWEPESNFDMRKCISDYLQSLGERKTPTTSATSLDASERGLPTSNSLICWRGVMWRAAHQSTVCFMPSHHVA